jgi:hypothetical protein
VANFYLDEDTAVGLAALLQQRGHQAVTTRDLGNPGHPDPLQLLTAARQQAILLTHNRKDFRLPHLAWHFFAAEWHSTTKHGGILLLRYAPPEVAAQRILAFLASGKPIENELYTYHEQRGWVWHPV